jgi:hypothetical protein
MNKRFFLIPLLIAASNFAQAAEVYKVKLIDPVIADGKELKAGDYKVEVNDTTAVFRNGKEITEIKMKTESSPEKYASTSVRYSQEGGKNSLQEIRVGGTKTKLVVESAKTASGGL